VDGIKVKRYASHRAVFGEHEVKAYRPWGRKKEMAHALAVKHVRLFAF
jgi:hypothetical protein